MKTNSIFRLKLLIILLIWTFIGLYADIYFIIYEKIELHPILTFILILPMFSWFCIGLLLFIALIIIIVIMIIYLIGIIIALWEYTINNKFVLKETWDLFNLHENKRMLN